MPDLELTLRQLGADLDWQPTPDLAAAVRPRLGERQPRRRRRALVLALAVLVLALAASLLVPQARTSILRFFHLGGVRVELVDRLPPARPRFPYVLGHPISLDTARSRLGEPPLLPDGRRPDGLYLDSSVDGGVVNLRYGQAARPRLLVTEFPTTSFDVIEKYAAAGRGVEPVTVAGRPGLWIAGPHAAGFGPLPPRLAGGALIWTVGDLTIRLEADVMRAEALELARRFRR